MANSDIKAADISHSADMGSDDGTRRPESTLEEGMSPADVPQVGLFRAVTITLACTLAMVNN
ncbi:hypothetical protein FRC12_023813, partial [Ceratobasidium sp. 428]